MIKRNAGAVAVAILLCSATAFAAPNLLVNGNFSSGLTGWNYTSNVFTSSDYWGFPSPSGDNSPFAVLLSDNSVPNPYLSQELNLPDQSELVLKLDFTFVTQEISWSDDFRAQINVGYPGGGGYNPIFSMGTGGGEWTSTGTGLRYYSVNDFTYDLTGWQGTQDFLLQFLVLGYTADNANSAMMLDDISIEAVPEPGTFLLVAAGLGLVANRIRRRSKV